MSLDIMPLCLAAGRKFNIQVILSVTSHSEFAKLHQHDHEAMYNNMGFVQWLQANSLSDSQHLSELCGEREVIGRSKSLSNDPERQTWSVNDSASVHRQKLILPHELREELDSTGQEIVFMDGVRGRGPVRLKLKSYRDIPEMAAIAGRNPYYDEEPRKDVAQWIESMKKQRSRN